VFVKASNIIDHQYVLPQTPEPSNVLIFQGKVSDNPSNTLGSQAEMPIPKEEEHASLSCIQVISPSFSTIKMALLNLTFNHSSTQLQDTGLHPYKSIPSSKSLDIS
jgi:hypothetical protein